MEGSNIDAPTNNGSNPLLDGTRRNTAEDDAPRRCDNSTPSSNSDLDQDCYQRAARVLRDADFLLILAGAGMSADSGLGTYETMPSRYREFCDPVKLATAPIIASHGTDNSSTPLTATRDEFQSFWWNFALQYASTEPHEGYAILDCWCHGQKLKRLSRPQNWHPDDSNYSNPRNGALPIRDIKWWVYTSNVDGHFKKFPSFRCSNFHHHNDNNNEIASQTATQREEETILNRDNICEIHGCALEFKCSCGIGYFDREAFPRMGEPWTRWNEGVETLARPSKVCKLLTETLDGLRAQKRQQQQQQQQQQYRSPSPPIASTTGDVIDVEVPMLCKDCRILPLRPNVLMFNDTDENILAPIRVYRHWYQEWEAFVESSVCSGNNDDENTGANFVLVELGCGTNVPAVRQESEEVLADTLYGIGGGGGSVKLIRINPKDAGIDNEQLLPHVISIPDTALVALKRIDGALDAILAEEVTTNG